MTRPPRSEYLRKYKMTRAGDLPHGTHNGYVNWSCRCEKCRVAHRIAVTEWRNRVTTR